MMHCEIAPRKSRRAEVLGQTCETPDRGVQSGRGIAASRQIARGDTLTENALPALPCPYSFVKLSRMPTDACRQDQIRSTAPSRPHFLPKRQSATKIAESASFDYTRNARADSSKIPARRPHHRHAFGSVIGLERPLSREPPACCGQAGHFEHVHFVRRGLGWD